MHGTGKLTCSRLEFFFSVAVDSERIPSHFCVTLFLPHNITIAIAIANMSDRNSNTNTNDGGSARRDASVSRQRNRWNAGHQPYSASPSGRGRGVGRGAGYGRGRGNHGGSFYYPPPPVELDRSFSLQRTVADGSTYAVQTETDEGLLYAAHQVRSSAGRNTIAGILWSPRSSFAPRSSINASRVLMELDAVEDDVVETNASLVDWERFQNSRSVRRRRRGYGFTEDPVVSDLVRPKDPAQQQAVPVQEPVQAPVQQPVQQVPVQQTVVQPEDKICSGCKVHCPNHR